MKVTYLRIFTVIAGISVVLLSSCGFKCEQGSGHQVSENRKVSDFTKIDISGGFKINLKQDSSLTVAVTADDNLLQYIKTEVSGGKLRIDTKSKNMCNSSPVVVTIGVRNIDNIKASGAVEITSEGKLRAKDLRVNLAGATKINMDVDAANVSTEGSGVTEVTLKGQASSYDVDLSGSGKVYALDFVVGNYNISTTGSSECQINVLRALNVESTGASTIKYKGSPSQINNHKTGASSITKIE